MKKFSSIQKATVKRTRQSVDSLVEKVNKINAKIEDLIAQHSEHMNMIEMMEAPIIAMTGFRSTDLCAKEKDEKTGQARFNFLYPETLIPVEIPQDIQEVLDTEDDPRDVFNSVIEDSMDTEETTVDEEYNY